MKITARDAAQAGMMIAVIEVCKHVLSGLPNVELTSFWIIMFTLWFGKKILFVIPAFILLEGAVWGFGLWWLMYLYAWPLLALIAHLGRKQDSWLFWAIVSGAFGLAFGAMCSIPYFIIGLSGGFIGGLTTAFSWWVAGIPWDIVHGVSNFTLMAVLYRPVSACMKRLAKG